MTGKYVYTPAELMDLSHSPLVAAPENMLAINEKDFQNPHSQDLRRSNRSSNEKNSSDVRKSRISNRKPDSRSFLAPQADAKYRDRRGRQDTPVDTNVAENPWLDPKEDDEGTGFDGFSETVAEFEKWKQAQRGGASSVANNKESQQAKDAGELENTGQKTPSDAIEEPQNKSETNDRNPQKETETDNLKTAGKSSKPPGNINISEEIWGADVVSPSEKSTNSRFRTLFSPSNNKEPVSQPLRPSPAFHPSAVSQTAATATHKSSPQSSTPQQFTPNPQNSQFAGSIGILPHGMMRPVMYPSVMPNVIASGYSVQPVMNTSQAMTMPPGMSVKPGMVPPGMSVLSEKKAPSEMKVPPGMTAPLGMTAPPGINAPPGMTVPPGMFLTTAAAMQNPKPPGMTGNAPPRVTKPPGMLPQKDQQAQNDDEFFAGLLNKRT